MVETLSNKHHTFLLSHSLILGPSNFNKLRLDGIKVGSRTIRLSRIGIINGHWGPQAKYPIDALQSLGRSSRTSAGQASL